TWSSSNPLVASVNSSGRVTALVPGQTNIVATVEGRTGSSSVTVSLVPVASVTIAPLNPSVETGKTVQFVATPRAQDGTVLTGREIFWSSSNPAVAPISSSGVATGLAPGASTI